MDKNTKCKFCIYLNKYNDEFIQNINNSIVSGVKYKDIIDLFNDSKIANDLQKPSKHYMEKHHNDCLYDFVPTIKKKLVKTTSVDVVETDEILDVLTYTDYSNKKDDEIPYLLKKEMFDIICKLLDISQHRLNKYEGSIKGGESIKESVQTLKIMIDLFNENIQISKSMNKEENMYELLNDEELDTVLGLLRGAKERKDLLNINMNKTIS